MDHVTCYCTVLYRVQPGRRVQGVRGSGGSYRTSTRTSTTDVVGGASTVRCSYEYTSTVTLVLYSYCSR